MSEINDLSRWSENVCFSRGQTLILGIDRAPKVSNSIGGIQADVSWILLSEQKSLMHVKLLFFLDIYNWTGLFEVCLAQSHGLILLPKQSYGLKSSLLVILKTKAVSKHWAFWDIFTFWILDVCCTKKYSAVCLLCLPHIGSFFFPCRSR